MTHCLIGFYAGVMRLIPLGFDRNQDELKSWQYHKLSLVFFRGAIVAILLLIGFMLIGYVDDWQVYKLPAIIGVIGFVWGTVITWDNSDHHKIRSTSLR